MLLPMSRKTCEQTGRHKLLVAWLLTIGMTLIPSTPLLSNPSGGTVIHGDVSFSAGASRLNIHQNSSTAIINWNDFSIGQGEVTQFFQPHSSASVLNRVTGGNLSAIYGRLQANGNVYLINPSGIVIGESGIINAGSFLASTHDVTNEEFLAGSDMNFQGSSNGTIINYGTVEAMDGDVVLIARYINNQGTLRASAGTVAIGAGSDVLLSHASDQRIFVRPGNEPVSNAKGEGIVNAGVIESAKAELKAAGGNLYALAIRNSGLIRAKGAFRQGSRVVLAAPGGKILQEGEIQAITGAGEPTPDVKIDAGVGGIVRVTGSIFAQTFNAEGGNIRIVGESVFLEEAEVNASGDFGGGVIEIGGSYQGADRSLTHSKTTFIGSGVEVNANAIVEGDAGEVIVWSDDATGFFGEVQATGGVLGGDGGFVEVSSAGFLDFAGNVDVSAVNGKDGELLLDPTDITLVSGTLANVGGSFVANNWVPTAGTSTIYIGDAATAGTLINLLQTGSVTISTASGLVAPGGGDIIVSGAISWSTANSLTLTANDAITVNAALSNSSSANVTLNAATTNLNAGITLSSGTLSGTATTVNVGVSGRVQNGVDAVATGGTVHLAAASYTGQVVIGKNLALDGAGRSTTTIQAPSTNMPVSFSTSGGTVQAIITVLGGTSVTISDLKVDGLFRYSPPTINANLTGIGFNNAGGTVSNVEITNIRQNPLQGNQSGKGVVGNVTSGTQSITVTNSLINNYQKSGIDMIANGGVLNVNINNNTITGSGGVTIIAQNGVVLRGAAGTISNNQISNNNHTGSSTATGVFLSNPSTSGVTVSGNTFTSNESALAGTGVNAGTMVNNNTFTSNTQGINFLSPTGNVTISNNTLNNNTWGMILDDASGTGSYALSSNAFSGGTAGLAPRRNATVTVNADTFTGSTFYVAMISAPNDVVTNPTVRYEGRLVSQMTEAQYDAVEARVFHKIDNAALGEVIVRPTTFVIPPVVATTTATTETFDNLPTLSGSYDEFDRYDDTYDATYLERRYQGQLFDVEYLWSGIPSDPGIPTVVGTSSFEQFSDDTFSYTIVVTTTNSVLQ